MILHIVPRATPHGLGTECIHTCRQVLNILIGIESVIPNFWHISGAVGTTTSHVGRSSRPSSWAGIVEVRVLDLSAHVSRMLNRSVTLTPLYESGLQVFKSAFQLVGRSVTIVVDSVISSCLRETTCLSVVKSLLQILTCIDDSLNCFVSSLQLIRCAGGVVINSQLSSDVGTQRFSLLQTCLQRQSNRVAITSGLVNIVTLGLYECLIGIIGHCLPINGTLSISDHVQTGVAVVTLPTEVFTVEIGDVSNESHVLETIRVVTYLGN